LAANFEQAIDLFLIKMLNENMSQDHKYIYLALGDNHTFHKELMMMQMNHLYRLQELLCITEKLPAGNILVPEEALQVEWLL
jgi:hypothetical protein